MQHVRHGFDYSDPASVTAQRSRLRDAVLKYKDHPALLFWGLGNEMEAFEPNEESEVIWRELNHLAGIIKDLDPHHPVMTVIAGAHPTKIAGILEHYPNMDILGVNAYSGAPVVGQNLVAMGWNGSLHADRIRSGRNMGGSSYAMGCAHRTGSQHQSGRDLHRLHNES